MADNETIADVIAAMRDEAARADMEQGYSIDDAAEMMREFAWRIEAAHRREAVTDCNQFGNVAKLREALKKILNLTNSLDEDCAVDPVEIRDIARAALAEPVRNCDVCTAAEQVERWNNESLNPYEWGDRQYLDAQEVLEWAQMPYEEGDSK